jgi:hypothetical protein
MLETYDAAARKSEARARSAGKGKRKAQLSATERAAHVKRFRESGAPSARAYALQHRLSERTFRDWLKAEKAGGLTPLPVSRDGSAGKRDRKELYPEVAEKLCQYLDLRATKISRDKCGVDYCIMQDKCMQYAKQIYAGDQDKVHGFTASYGWIARVLQRNEIEGTVLAGEAAEISDEQAAREIGVFRVALARAMEERDVPFDSLKLPMLIVTGEGLCSILTHLGCP